MIILSVDLGDVRTGLAVCDREELLAAPLGTLEERSREKLAARVAWEAAARRAGLCVVGLPVNMDGSRGPRAQAATAFAQKLRVAAGLPVVLWDERGTTITAHQELNITNTRGKKRKAVVDTLSASIILEGYLAWRRSHPGQNGPEVPEPAPEEELSGDQDAPEGK